MKFAIVLVGIEVARVYSGVSHALISLNNLQVDLKPGLIYGRILLPISTEPRSKKSPISFVFFIGLLNHNIKKIYDRFLFFHSSLLYFLILFIKSVHLFLHKNIT